MFTSAPQLTPVIKKKVCDDFPLHAFEILATVVCVADLSSLTFTAVVLVSLIITSKHCIHSRAVLFFLSPAQLRGTLM